MNIEKRVAERFVLGQEKEEEKMPSEIQLVPPEIKLRGKPREVQRDWPEIMKLIKEETPEIKERLEKVEGLYERIRTLGMEVDKFRNEAARLEEKAIESKIEQKKIFTDLAKIFNFDLENKDKSQFLVLRFRDSLLMMYKKLTTKTVKPTTADRFSHLMLILKRDHDDIIKEIEENLVKWEERVTEDAPELLRNAVEFIEVPKGVKEASEEKEAQVMKKVKGLWRDLVSGVASFWSWTKDQFRWLGSMTREINSSVALVEEI